METNAPASTESGDLSRSGPAFALIRALRPNVRRIVAVRTVGGGYTEASVLVCDIDEAGDPGDEALLRGQYIVKISDATTEHQAEMHQTLVDRLGTFAATHIPPLLVAASDDVLHADVYGIANFGLRSLRAADEIDFSDMSTVTRQVAGDLLAGQLEGADLPDYTPSIGDTLRGWLPALFEPGRRQNALRSIAERLGAGEAPLFVHQGEYLPNPIHVWAPENALYREKAAVLRGPTHGDLHLRNILVGGAKRTKNLSYWIIDVGWGEPTALLYDQAYLEVSVFINELRHDGPRSPLAALSAVDQMALTVPAITLPRDQGFLELVEGIRRSTTDVLERVELRRRDIWQLQYPLARVAAGLNWATKPTNRSADEALRSAAFLYAAWATKVLILNHFPSHMTALVQENEAGRRSVTSARAPSSSVSTHEAQELLATFLESRGGEDLYLITDEGFGLEQMRNLAYVHWAAIFDLDPATDETGLGVVLGPRLRMRQHITQAGLTAPDVEREGVVWLHANGWTSHAEPRPNDFDAWRRTYLPTIRHIIDRKAIRNASRAAAVLVLRSSSSNQLTERVREAIDEQYEGRVELVELAMEPADGRYGVADILDAIAPTLPGTVSPYGVVVPGNPAPVGIPVDDQLWIGEDLEILHSGLIAQAASSQPRDDEFWRGRPPSWVDLAAGLDVPRRLQPELQGLLENALAGPRPARIELAHSPGAGGTTLARRIAWDLSTRYPTVLLRQFSPGTLGRLQELSKITNCSILLVAEAAHVSEAEMEELQGALVKRSVRVVTLWVNRTNVTREPTSGTTMRALRDPMHGNEPRLFADVYEPQAETSAGRAQIRILGQPESVAPHPQWLSPFFFGLCAYERNFSGVHDFVRRHVAELTPSQRQVAKHLALVTRYGQLGIPVHLLRYWLTGQWSRPVPAQTLDEEMRELLGDDLRHITVIDGHSARLMHPQVAERALQELLGGTDPTTWQRNLPDASVDFINQLTGTLGRDNLLTLKLLENLFLRRTKDDHDRGGNFSEIISSFSRQSAHRVLEQLTVACPNEPHFWNHLGRHMAYEMRAEYPKAEQYLQRAVELSHGKDAIHLHTLGQVRRIAIEQQIKSVMERDEQAPTAQRLRDDIAGQFAAAMDAFARARAIAPESEHSYITPVQLIVHVLERLRRTSGYESLPELIAGDKALTGWVSEQFALAESLLEDYRNIKAGRLAADSRHYRDLERSIEELYGNVEFLIRQWREQLEDNEERASIGRALARAHIRRAGRNWSLLSESDLREIEACLDNAMRVTRPTESDLRTWFQAYRRLPEYDELRALDRFSSIVEHMDSLEAYYYLYVLHFLRWYRGDEFSQDAIRSYIDRSSKLARLANNQWSYEWLGMEPARCPLVHFTELGEWLGASWSNVAPLRRITGVIQEIAGPQFGTVRVGDGRLVARFIPGDKFRRSRDENALVDFFLGFTYEGLRALEVELSGQWRPSRVQRLAHPFVRPPTSARSTLVPTLEPKSPAGPEPAAVQRSPRPTVTTPPASTAGFAQIELSSTDDLAVLIDDLIRQAGGELDLMTLGSILSAGLGNRYDVLRGGRKLKKLVEDLGYEPVPQGSKFIIRPKSLQDEPNHASVRFVQQPGRCVRYQTLRTVISRTRCLASRAESG